MSGAAATCSHLSQCNNASLEQCPSPSQASCQSSRRSHHSNSISSAYSLARSVGRAALSPPRIETSSAIGELETRVRSPSISSILRITRILASMSSTSSVLGPKSQSDAHSDVGRGSIGPRPGPIYSDVLCNHFVIQEETSEEPSGALWARALYDFESDDELLLSFSCGDTIEIIGSRGRGWRYGVLHAKRGWLQSSFVLLISQTEAQNSLTLQPAMVQRDFSLLENRRQEAEIYTILNQTETNRVEDGCNHIAPVVAPIPIPDNHYMRWRDNDTSEVLHDEEFSIRDELVSESSPDISRRSLDLSLVTNKFATIGIKMTSNDVIHQLVQHGCRDITLDLDLSTCSEYPVSNGGFGDVYRGRLNQGSVVAIKCMRIVGRMDDGQEQRRDLKHAAREIHTWSKLQHPNVLRLLGLVQYRGQIGMVSPWVEGGSLRDHLVRTPKANRPWLCTQIADGLSYMHEYSVIHGDLKGDNVLVSEVGEPLLTDFGNAVLQGRTLQFTSTTTKSSLSPRWTAPELFKGEPASFQADVFALGMTILETFTGNVPYAGKGDMAVMFSITGNQPPGRPESHIPSSSVRGDMLWSLLRSCWAVDPIMRPTAASVKDRVGAPERMYAFD